MAFHPEAFYDPFSPEIHYPMVRVIDAPGVAEKAVAAPRGIGKSTLGNTINIERKHLMLRKRYTLLISDTLDQSSEHLKPLKTQFESNERLIQVFGNMVGDKWKEDQIVLANGSKIRAMGSGQQVRGRREGFDRPDYAVFDDFESEESVTSETTLARKRKWKSDDLRNSLNRHTGEILHLGTVLASNSILEEDLNNPQIMSVRLELFDDLYNSRWPEVYPNEKIQAMLAMARYENNLDGFYRDYRNIPVAHENRKFEPGWFKNWPEDLKWGELIRFLILDPARTKKLTSDYTAMVAAGATIYGNGFELESKAIREVNDDMYEEAYQLCVRWLLRDIYVETNGLEDYITQPLQNYMRKRGWLCNVWGIHSSGAKEDRIATLRPGYKKGHFWHSPHAERVQEVAGVLDENGQPQKWSELEAQLLNDRSKYDDLKDCWATFTKIMTMRNLGRLGEDSKIYIPNSAVMRRSSV